MLKSYLWKFRITACALALLLLFGCDQNALDKNSTLETNGQTVQKLNGESISFQAAKVDEQLVAREKGLSSQVEEITQRSDWDVRYKEKQPTVLRFGTKEEYRDMVYAKEGLAYRKGRPIEVSSSLASYTEEDVYLTAAELSFFNDEGKIIIGDTLAVLKQDKLIATSLTTGKSRSYPLAKNAYGKNGEILPNRLCGPNEDPPGCEEPPPPPPPPPCSPNCGDDGDDGGDGGGGGAPNPTSILSRERFTYSETQRRTYNTRVLAYNRSFNTGFPLFRSWSEAKTSIRFYEQGFGWVELEQDGFFPDMSVTATVKSVKRVGTICTMRSNTKTDSDGYIRAEQNRCDGEGTESTHSAEAGYNRGRFVWPGGRLEVDLL